MTGFYGPGFPLCEVCQIGNYCPFAATSMLNCTNGTYAANPQLGECPQCPAGKFANTSALTMCYDCSIGTYAFAGSSTCSLVNTTVVFNNLAADSPFYRSINSVAVGFGSVPGCTSLTYINDTATSYFQSRNGVCTDTWVFSTLSWMGPHRVHETCDVTGTMQFQYTVTYDPAALQWVFFQIDSFGNNSIYTWTSGCTLVTPPALDGYWTTDRGQSCYRMTNLSATNLSVPIGLFINTTDQQRPSLSPANPNGVSTTVMCTMTLAFTHSTNTYQILCPGNSNPYLGTLMFGTLGPNTPIGAQRSRKGFSFLFQQNQQDRNVAGFDKHPTVVINPVITNLQAPQYLPQNWPVSQNGVLAANVFNSCPCGVGTCPPCGVCVRSFVRACVRAWKSLPPPHGFVMRAAFSVSFAGFAWPGSFGAMVPSCTACPVGKYSAEFSTFNTTVAVCQPCPAGTYNPSTGAPECIPCPTGQFCPPASTWYVNCSIGRYNKLMSQPGPIDTSCLMCPPGNYCPTIGMTNFTSCNPGTYNTLLNQTSANSCLVCPSGNYCPVASPTFVNCSAGKFNTQYGQPSADSCVGCPTGQYCPLASTWYVNCSIGRYNKLMSQPGPLDTSCLLCPVGNYCPTIGMTNFTSCDPGWYQWRLGASAPLPCPSGFYCPVPTLHNLTLLKCWPGYYCPPYSTLGTGGIASALLCPAGMGGVFFVGVVFCLLFVVVVVVVVVIVLCRLICLLFCCRVRPCESLRVLQSFTWHL